MANNDLVTPRSPKCPLMAKIMTAKLIGQANIVVPDCLKEGCACWNEVLERCGLRANTFSLEQTRRLDSLEREIGGLGQRITTQDVWYQRQLEILAVRVNATIGNKFSEHTHGE